MLNSNIKRFFSVLFMLFLLTFIAFYLHITNGSFDMSITEVIKTFLRIDPNEQHDLVIFEFRLPRIVIAMVIGIGLGVAGVVLQAVTRNELADPGILGINAGTLSAGAPADIALVDLNEEWTVDVDKLHGKSKNTPFKGRRLCGKVKKTFLGGKMVYEDK